MNSIPFAGLASAFSEKGLGAFMSLQYSSTQFNFGTASAGAGFAAKSLFTRIVAWACRHFASRLRWIGLEAGR
jgi:hypothetical protein